MNYYFDNAIEREERVRLPEFDCIVHKGQGTKYLRSSGLF